jgi:ABC-2 type transport system permease protein
MKLIFAITQIDILQILRDKLSFMFLLGMPILLTLMFGLAFGGSGSSGSGETRLPAGWLDLDHSSASAGLKSLLQADPSLDVQERANPTAASLEALVAGKQLAAAVVVPAGYAASLQTAAPLKLVIYADPAVPNGLAARKALLGAAVRLGGAAEAAHLAAQAKTVSFETALGEALAGWSQPPVTINPVAAVSRAAQGGNSPLLAVSQTAPGMMVQFGIAGLLTAAQMLVAERKSRCLQRLLTTRAARHEILLGHFLAIFSVTFCQFLLLIAFGQLVFGLNYSAQLAATLAMAAATAVFIAALGLLIGALARSDDQAILFALVPMFVLAGLGGAWVPLASTGEVFQAVGHLSPVAWAMDGFKSILAGAGPEAIGLPALALLGYGLLFGGLAIWKFKF